MKFAALFVCLFAVGAWGSTVPRQPLKGGFEGYIIGGTDALPGQYPAQLSLRSNGNHNCGASVLNENWAITAAHCVSSATLPQTTFLSGTNDITVGGTVHQAVEIYMHEAYSAANSWINDIALVQVDPPFDLSSANVETIPMPVQDQPTAANSNATVIGWGRLSQGGPLPTKLQTVGIWITDQAQCQGVYNGIGYNVFDSQICADGQTTGNIGSCNGDSGGPLTVGGVVVGLVSWAQGCATPGFPTVYTRVSSYIDWIEAKVGPL